MTTTTTSVFYLEKPPKSIFADIECREYPTLEMIYGFIHSGMGVKLRKKWVSLYADEQEHYKNYIKKIQWIGETQFIRTTYYQPSHMWGRINPTKALSGSLFHRPSRHSFFNENYVDCDMVNCQLDIALKMGRKYGLADLDGLEEYCANPKKCRRDIADHYHLKDMISDDGVVYTAIEQAKKLPIRLAFGGGLYKWKQENNVRGLEDMPLIIKMEKTLKTISVLVNQANPHIREDLSADDYFNVKSPDEQNRTIMATFAQTWERILQEEFVAYLCRTYSSILLQDIIPSQDGVMLLKRQIGNIDLTEVFRVFREIQQNKFGFAIDWIVKPFDECIHIPTSKIMPIDVFYEDLEKGERHIASIIYPAFKNTVKYYEVEDEKRWYYLENNLWVSSDSPPTYMIIEVLQQYIEKEVHRYWNKFKAETSDDKRKILSKIREKIDKHYCNVGRPSFSRQLCREYLSTLLKDNAFIKKLDKTAGKFPFKDGLLDLKTGLFAPYKPEDYITLTSSIEWNKIVPDGAKMETLRGHLKKINNNKDSHLEYMLGIVGHSFTGDASLEKSIYYIVDGTENQVGDNGKTFLFTLLQELFPEFVTQTDPKALEDGYAKAHKHISKWKNMRLIYCDEGTKKKVNAALLKKIGDGLRIENEIMFGVTEEIPLLAKMFVCTNHLPKIDKDEEAVYNRLKQINLSSHFDRTGNRTEENIEKLEFIADPMLSQTLLENYRNEIVALVINYAMKYYKNGIPPIPTEYLAAVAETKHKNNDFAVWWYKTFEPCDDNGISLDTVVSYGNLSREDTIKEAKRINIVYNKDLKGFGKKTNKDGKEVYIKGGFVGWKVKEVEEVEGGEEL